MRPPIDNPKTRMNSALESTGATTVCVQSFVTRSISRPASAIRPRWRSARLLIASTLAAVLLVAAPADALQLIGHRGARGLAPENTLPVFMPALHIGVSAIETDVMATKDGHLILRHDPRVTRALCTGGYARRF